MICNSAAAKIMSKLNYKGRGRMIMRVILIFLLPLLRIEAKRCSLQAGAAATGAKDRGPDL